MRLRLLPVLIVVAVVAVPLKVGGLWWAIGEGTPARAEEETGAAEIAADGAEGAAPERASGPGPESEEFKPVEYADDNPLQSAAEPKVSEPTEGEPEATPTFQKADLRPDPFELTDEEIEILQSLAERREILDERERDLERRTAVLAAAEARIEEKIAKLESLRASIEQLVAENEKRNDAQIESLSKIYSAMKPKEAANIFESLEIEVVLSVLGRMKERTSAAILAKMNPTRAQAVTLQLAQQNQLPIPKE